MENIKGINYYIVVAHLDDIEFGLTKYLKKIKETDNVFIYVASGGFYKHSDSTNFARRQTQIKNTHEIFSKKIKINIRIENSKYDTLFFKNKCEIRDSLEYWISDKVNNKNKNILISIAPDIHDDHRIISELCDVIARPNLRNFSKSKFQSYIKFYIPDNYNYLTTYNLGPVNTFDTLRYNTIYYKLTQDDLEFKSKILKRYPKEIIRNNFLLSELNEQEIVTKVY